MKYTDWLTKCRRQFEMHFPERKIWIPIVISPVKLFLRVGFVSDNASDEKWRQQESNNVPLAQYPTVHHFMTEVWSHVYISVTKWCIVGYRVGALYDFCDRSIVDVIAYRTIRYNKVITNVFSGNNDVIITCLMWPAASKLWETLCQGLLLMTSVCLSIV